MPSAKQVSWAQLRVGVMAVAALILLGVLVFLLSGSTSLFSRTAVVYTYMDDSSAMTKGSAVRLNGILVGKVSAIDLSGENTPNRIVRMSIEVGEDRLSVIPQDSIVSVGAENLLGTKYLNIQKGKSRTQVRAGGELKSRDTREFQDLVNAAYPAMESLQNIIARLDKIVGLVESGKGSIGKLLVDDELYQRIVRTVAEVQKVVEAVSNGKGTMGKLLYDDAIYEQVKTSLNRADSLLQGLQEGSGTAGKLLKDPALYDDVRKSVAQMNKLLDELNTGKGTAGKLLKSDELHRRVSTLVTKLDKMVIQFDTMAGKINAGEGTLGQLLVNPQLYESLNGTAREVQGVMKDFRANPKKFLTIQLKLF